MSKENRKNYYNSEKIIEKAKEQYILQLSSRYSGKSVFMFENVFIPYMFENVLIPYLEKKSNEYGELFGNNYKESIQILIAELELEKKRIEQNK